MNINTDEMEIALAQYFNPRYRLIIPRMSWGFGIHECDLIVVTKSGYATEVEIKVSKSDLIKDSKKTHGHFSSKISYLYFAIPDYLKDSIDKIPERAGVLVVKKDKDHIMSNSQLSYSFNVSHERNPKLQLGYNGKPEKYKLTIEEQFKIARLGALRIWKLKEKLLEAKKNEQNI
jgi:hypothetical protein